ncbi:MAG: diversity-generating retroelement protein Avd [Candidatus Levybacteria bacterium]|nr:diversity-generating retroelement protein Avd [Candidatus Levybacteria bacterium]
MLLSLFPKGKRYTLGQKIDQVSLEIFENIILAGYLPREQKLPVLQKVSIKLDLLKILLRLAFETKCLDNKKYQQLVEQLLEIGKMLGGWIKTLKM